MDRQAQDGLLPALDQVRQVMREDVSRRSRFGPPVARAASENVTAATETKASSPMGRNADDDTVGKFAIELDVPGFPARQSLL